MCKAGMVWPESIAAVSNVAIPLNKIKDAVLATENVSTETPARAVRISIISLRDLFANINPADGKFLIPCWSTRAFACTFAIQQKSRAPGRLYMLPLTKPAKPIRPMLKLSLILLYAVLPQKSTHELQTKVFSNMDIADYMETEYNSYG